MLKDRDICMLKCLQVCYNGQYKNFIHVLYTDVGEEIPEPFLRNCTLLTNTKYLLWRGLIMQTFSCLRVHGHRRFVMKCQNLKYLNPPMYIWQGLKRMRFSTVLQMCNVDTLHTIWCPLTIFLSILKGASNFNMLCCQNFTDIRYLKKSKQMLRFFNTLAYESCSPDAAAARILPAILQPQRLQHI